MSKMNKAVKKLWVEALLSKKYKQGTTALRIGKGFCCLGVLCEVYRKETKAGKWSKGAVGNWIFLVKGAEDEEATAFLPQAVVAWAGLQTSAPHVEDTSLAALNDNGDSFEEIAAKIQKYL